MKADQFKLGGYWAHCDECGFQRRRGDCAKDWEGRLVCADTCLDKRNPQEEIRAHQTIQHVLDARDAEPVFVADNQVLAGDL